MNDLPLTLLDHAFVVIVLLVLFPFAGWWSYQQYTTKGAQTGERALVREYQITIFWLLCLLGATLAVWGINGRPIQGLYVNWNLTEYRALAIGGCIAIGFVVLLRPILVAFNKGMALQMALAYQPLSDFLPRTPRELVWGLLVSVAAGICEEIAYRGFLLPYLHSLFTPMILAIIVSSAIFGAAHLYQGILGVITTSFVGVLFAVLYLSTGTLIGPIIIHILMDIAAMVTAFLAFRAQDRASAEQSTLSNDPVSPDPAS
ncbi:MAG: hypothetical protein CME88_12610 [Hirschia sp.]|nr:hypothetical protein [Hirschia sp.]MBF19209.1 hypothetical protein [Hirschia sp.]|tara:strand:+ start:683 stop:1459 length:777 start_codon:yes stop_codon:yes gene_type:complete